VARNPTGSGMKTITLKVNGETRQATLEPRTSLADFLREELLLTGTHLGCEHGVCGACTVNIDGAPARSCITYAVACDGTDITTIEGFDDDDVMAELRHGFTTEHALQCGFCTPGMLITARDIVDRLDTDDEKRIRVELSGNLCRCTGYVGIVGAIRGVIAGRKESADIREAPKPAPPLVAPLPAVTTPGSSGPHAVETLEAGGAMTELKQSFTINHPRNRVWMMFANLPKVATCMPGASLSGPPEDGHFVGRISIKLGPIHTDFAGEGDVELNANNFSGVLRGSGLDKNHSSRAHGEISYGLTEERVGSATRVDVLVAYALSGTLAQFTRGGIVEALAGQIVETFAANLETALESPEIGRSPPPNAAGELDMGSLVFSAVWRRIKLICSRIFSRS
jgi:aerobic carbon-monoxide dehydrogenase small subunit